MQHEACEEEAHQVVRQVEGNQLGRHGGADVGAHDDAEGLLQRHEPGIDEAHGHDRRGAARLQDRRDDQAGQDADGGDARQGLEDLLELLPCRLPQAVAHEFHAVQEQGQTAQKSE